MKKLQVIIVAKHNGSFFHCNTIGNSFHHFCYQIYVVLRCAADLS